MTALNAITKDSTETGIVLAVDDDAFTRSCLSRFLSSEGIPHEICSDPDEAVARCAAQPSRYALVLMDIRFPQGNVGLDASRRIAANTAPERPAVIGMTSHSALYDRKDWSESGMEDVIVKPLFKWLVVNLARQYGAANMPLNSAK